MALPAFGRLISRIISVFILDGKVVVIPAFVVRDDRLFEKRYCEKKHAHSLDVFLVPDPLYHVCLE